MNGATLFPMRTRHRNRSQEITFNLKVQTDIQLAAGGTGAAAVRNGRQATAAFSCMTSQSPLFARFLELPQPVGGS
jgi:hypothetical protein